MLKMQQHARVRSQPFILIFMLLLGSFLLQACGGATNGSTGPVTLRFVGWNESKQLRDVITSFENQNPNIKIQVESVPFAQLNDVLQQRLSSGGSDIDIYTADQPRVAALAQRNFLLDLTDKVGDVKGTLLDSAIEASTVNGKLYALPVTSSTLLLYYNTDLLKKAGVEPPTVDPAQRWTWEQVVAAGQKSQSTGAKYGVFFEQVNRYYQLQPLVESADGGSGITGDTMLTPALTTPGWTKAAKFYHDLFANGLAPRGVPPEQSVDLFKNGEVAFFVAGPWQLSTIAENKDLSFGVAAHPYFEGGKPVTATGAWSWGINPKSQHQEEAIKFLKYAALTTEGAQKTADQGGLPTLSANVEALDQYFTQSMFQAENVKGVSDLMKYEMENTAVIRPRTIGYIQFEDIIGKTFEDISNGADPTQRLQQATDDLKAAWSRL